MLHTLFTTTLSVLDAVFLTHLKHAGLTLYRADSLWGPHGHVVYGPLLPPRFAYEPFDIVVGEDVSCMCAGLLSGGPLHYNTTTLLAAAELHAAYMHYLSHPSRTPAMLADLIPPTNQHSCTLFDNRHMAVLLVSDKVGAVPLWYALSGDYAVATTDLIGAQRLGFNMSLTPLGPGQSILLDLARDQVDFVQWSPRELLHKPLREAGRESLKMHLQVHAKQLFDAAKRALMSSVRALEGGAVSSSSSAPAPSVPVYPLLEVDPTEAASLLLDCAGSALKLSRAARRSKALVADTPMPLAEAFRALVEGVPDPRHAKSIVWKPPFLRVAAERWRLCEAALWQLSSLEQANLAQQAASAPGSGGGVNVGADAQPRSRTLFAFDTGLQPRPFNVYLQNLFCTALGVDVVYPLGHGDFQAALWSEDHPSSALYLSLDLLSAAGQCNSSLAKDPSQRTRLFQWSGEATATAAAADDGDGDLLLLDGAFRSEDEAWPHEARSTATATCEASDCVDFLVQEEPETRMQQFITELGIRPSAALRDVAVRHADADGYLVVVLATSGYKDMLANFLCTATTAPVQNTHILVVTPNADVADVAREFGVGAYTPQEAAAEGDALLGRSQPPLLDVADFGTLQYQELMLFRTETVMELLLLGFRPVIADIDTVWLSDPVAIVKRGNLVYASRTNASREFESVDLSVTNDNGEICGCFVAVNNTPKALEFFATVVSMHQQLVRSARTAFLFDNVLDKFSESEQKVLTRLLVQKQYKGSIYGSVKVRMLGEEFFPSGFKYFNMHASFRRNESQAAALAPAPAPAATATATADALGGSDASRDGAAAVFEDGEGISFASTAVPTAAEAEAEADDGASLDGGALVRGPAVVHNNFLIGLDMKRTRFARYNLWTIGDSIFGHPASAVASFSWVAQCGHNPLSAWQRLFHAVHKDVRLPTLSIGLPVHDSSYPEGSTMVQVGTEGVFPTRVKALLHVESDPPAFLDFNAIGVYQVALKGDRASCGFTAQLQGTNVEVSVDLGIERTDFAMDRGGAHHRQANEHVLKTVREADAAGGLGDPLVDQGMQAVLGGFSPPPAAVAAVSGRPVQQMDAPAPDDMRFTIRVLAYNRPESLRRLLESLLKADFMGDQVSLIMLIDAHRTIDDLVKVRATQTVAEQFLWPHGDKRVVVNEGNNGLSKQWYFAWQPSAESEAAFIFEDDLEVSPLFYRWTRAAVGRYYTMDQRRLHRQMLLAVRDHIRVNGSASAASPDGLPPLERFARDAAGRPLMYGVCLQKQHLDPAHYPKRLDVRNGHRPFLFSLVGSWGPLLLPLPWRAFREWWAWRSARARASDELFPITEKLVVNHFYRNNAGIWTPWIVRFAYETGAKCLYSNLPGNASLMTNHREKGENYGTTMGAETATLSNESVQAALALAAAPAGAAPSAAYRDSLALLLSLVYFPTWPDVARWQYDLNLRRAGAFGAERLYAHEDTAAACAEGSAVPELCAALSAAAGVVAWHRALAPSAPSAALTAQHWLAAAQLLEAVLPPAATVMHLTPTPLLPLLLARFRHHVYAPRGDLSCHTRAALGGAHQLWLDAFRAALDDARGRGAAVCTTDSPVQLQTVAVVDLSHLKTQADPAAALGTAQAQLWLHGVPVAEYLLIVDVCAAAPTDLTLRGAGGGGAAAADADAEYVLVEDLCAEGKIDIGVTLFRRLGAHAASREEWARRRHAVSRQLQHDLVHRRIVLRVDDWEKKMQNSSTNLNEVFRDLIDGLQT